jgi:hypothetical protein
VGAPPAEPVHRGDSVEVCGLGRVTAGDLERLYPDEVRAEAAQRLVSDLGRGDDRQQALGWLLMQSLAIDRATLTQRRACNNDVECLMRVDSQSVPAATQALEALAALAQRSRDPWVYAVTVNYACGRTARASRGVCATLSPEQWAERDPTDAAPWLWAAGLADERKDPEALRAALRRAAQAPKMTPNWGMVYEPLERTPAWQQMKPIERMPIAIELIGRSAAVSMEGRPAMTLCGAPRAGDGEQAALCAGLVRLFTSDASTLLQHGIGTRIAARMAMGEDIVRPLEDARDALQTFATDERHIGKPDEVFTCNGLRRLETTMTDTARLGEVGAHRKAMAASGRPFEEWARIGREARLAREARAAPR